MEVRDCIPSDLMSDNVPPAHACGSLMRYIEESETCKSKLDRDMQKLVGLGSGAG